MLGPDVCAGLMNQPHALGPSCTTVNSMQARKGDVCPSIFGLSSSAHTALTACMQIPMKGVQGKACSLVEVVTEAYG